MWCEAKKWDEKTSGAQQLRSEAKAERGPQGKNKKTMQSVASKIKQYELELDCCVVCVCVKHMQWHQTCACCNHTPFSSSSDLQWSARVPEAGSWSQAVLQPLQAGQEAQQADPVCRGTHPRAEVCVCGGVCLCVFRQLCICVNIQNNIPSEFHGLC